MMYFKNFAVNFVADLALVLVIYSIGYEGGLTLSGVGRAAGSLFGGIPSLLAIVGLVGVLALFWFLVRFLAIRNHNSWAATAGLVGVIAAGFGWWKLVSLPEGNLWLLVVFVIFVAVHAAANTWPSKS